MTTPKDTSISNEFFIPGFDKEAIKARVDELLDTYGEGVLDKIKTEKDIRLRYFLEDDGEIIVTVHRIFNYSSTKLRYSKDGKTLESADKDITIAILNDKVEVIKENAFANCEKLTTVFIPSGLKIIKAYAFDGCKKLQRINIPNSVETIESYAFKDCKSLRNLYLGYKLRHLSGFAFEGSGLSFISLYEDTNIDKGVAFLSTNNRLIINFIRTYDDQNGGNLFDPSVCDFPFGWPHILISVENDYFRKVYEGVLVEIFYNDEVEDEEYVVTAVPNDAMIIPNCADVLGSYCLGISRTCPLLYIPNSIDKIEIDVLPSYKKYLITEDVNKLLAILPSDNNDNDIIELKNINL